MAAQQRLGRRRAHHLDPVAAPLVRRGHGPHPAIEAHPVDPRRHAHHHRGAPAAAADQEAVPDSDPREVGAQLGDRCGGGGKGIEQGAPLERAGAETETPLGGEAGHAIFPDAADAVETGQGRRQLDHPAQRRRPEDPLGAIGPDHGHERIADAEFPADLPVVDRFRRSRGDEGLAVRPQLQAGEAGQRRDGQERDGGQGPARAAEGGAGERIHEEKPASTGPGGRPGLEEKTGGGLYCLPTADIFTVPLVVPS